MVLSKDLHDKEERLNDNERYFISRLCILLGTQRCCQQESRQTVQRRKAQAAEARCFYGFQIVMYMSYTVVAGHAERSLN